MENFFDFLVEVAYPLFDTIIAVIVGILIAVCATRINTTLITLKVKRRAIDSERSRLLNELERDISDETREKYQKKLRSYILRDVFQIISILCLFGLLYYFVRQVNQWSEGISDGLHQVRNDRIESVDRRRDDMHFRTVRQDISLDCSQAQSLTAEGTESCVEYLENELEINNQEYICNLRASIEGEKLGADDLAIMNLMERVYRLCMLEDGWFVEDCSSSEEFCVELLFVESFCTSATRRWLENGGDDQIVSRCENEYFFR